jgi:hypothetical protein
MSSIFADQVTSIPNAKNSGKACHIATGHAMQIFSDLHYPNIYIYTSTFITYHIYRVY